MVQHYVDTNPIHYRIEQRTAAKDIEHGIQLMLASLINGSDAAGRGRWIEPHAFATLTN